MLKISKHPTCCLLPHDVRMPHGTGLSCFPPILESHLCKQTQKKVHNRTDGGKISVQYSLNFLLPTKMHKVARHTWQVSYIVDICLCEFLCTPQQKHELEFSLHNHNTLNKFNGNNQNCTKIIPIRTKSVEAASRDSYEGSPRGQLSQLFQVRTRICVGFERIESWLPLQAF